MEAEDNVLRVRVGWEIHLMDLASSGQVSEALPVQDQQDMTVVLDQ